MVISKRVYFAAAVSGWLTCVPCRFAAGGVSPLAQSVVVNESAGDATFTLDFGHEPRLHTLDAKGDPVDSFQYEIAADPAPGEAPLANLTAIVRGSEIGTGDVIPIRLASPPDAADAAAGGWGPVVGTVPFELEGSQLSFTAPLQLLGTADGNFAYRVFTLEDGAISASADGPAESVPVPPAFWTGLAAIALLILAAFARAARNCSAL